MLDSSVFLFACLALGVTLPRHWQGGWNFQRCHFEVSDTDPGCNDQRVSMTNHPVFIHTAAWQKLTMLCSDGIAHALRP